MKHYRVDSYRRRIAILAAYDKGCPVNMFTASGRMNLYEGKGFNKLVCVIGCHCIITQECIGSHTVMSQ